MYDLRFEAAHRTFDEWERKHPDDPMGPVSDAAAHLFSEFDRLKILQSEFFTDNAHFFRGSAGTPDAAAKREFDAALERGRRLSDRILARSPQDRVSLFAGTLSHGLRADYLAMIEKRYMASLAEVKLGRVVARKLLDTDPAFYDAYLAIGVENYL